MIRIVILVCVLAGLKAGPVWAETQTKIKPRAESSGSGAFQCGEKHYCKRMTSCAEARFHLEQCGKSKLDRDGDGLPCENVCKR